MSQVQKPWLKHYPENIPHTLDYPDSLVHEHLKEAYEKAPNHVAVRFLGKSVTYKEVYESAIEVAHGLHGLGIKPGDRVAIMLPNCPQYVISYYGILMAGAVVVQTNPLLTERELEYLFNNAEVDTVIAIDLVYPRLAKILSNTPLKHLILTSIKDYLPFPKNLLYPLVQRKQGMKVNVKYGGNIIGFKNWIASQEKNPFHVDVSPDDLAVLQYTGGTTGKPKGVMLTHRNLVVNTHQCDVWNSTAKYGEERSLGIVPFFHVYGMTTVLNMSVKLASTMVLLPKFDVEDTLKTIQKEKPTQFPGAPTMYIALINHPDVTKYDLSSIKACISGSAPLPLEVQQRFEELTKGKLVEGYGLSETSPVTHANFIDGKNIIGSIGVPWPDTEVVVLDLETGEPVGINEKGEIAIKGPQVMKGYWNRPDATEEAFKDGWFMTGDIGYMDEEGFFYIVDRKKDMIIAGGYNVYPREVEEVLYEHEAVKECAVIGVPDEYRGETVKAFIVKKDNITVTEEELDAFCRGKMASYKVPRLYEFRDELPKSLIGKVLRRVLVEEEQKKREEAQGNQETKETVS